MVEQISWRKPSSQTAVRAPKRVKTPKAQIIRADLQVDINILTRFW